MAEPARSEAIHVGPWTEDDLFELPDDGQRHELVEGSLIVTPPPGVDHQVVAMRLVRLLGDLAPPDLEPLQTVGVRLGETTVLVPDVVVLESAATGMGRRTLQPAEVRLVVEIVSPGSGTMDRLTKPALCAAAGIPAFWRVELGMGPSVFAYRLEQGSYVEEGAARPGQVLEVGRPFAVRFEPATLLG